MNIVFISNRLSNHQVPLCRELYKLCDQNFYFIETLKECTGWHIGWRADSHLYPFVIQVDKVYSDLTGIKRIIFEADAVIIGSAPDSLIVKRLKNRKLTFKYAERFYKQGINLHNVFRIIGGTWLHHGRFQKYKLNMLCASAYTPQDCRLFHNYTDRMYKWGYFPPLISYDVDALMKLKHSVSILWVARFIEWKHPEIAIEVAKRLKAENIPFHLTMVGDGHLKGQIEELIKEYSLQEEVLLTGNIKPNEVRNLMEKAAVFLFTSDKNEGWGAVLNEAMNSGCAVVASHAIGSVPYLIENDQNGLVYQSGKVDALYQRVKYLLDNPKEQKRLGKAAYETIVNEWNAEVAAERLVKLSEHLLAGEKYPDLYQTGPCSKAKLIKNEW